MHQFETPLHLYADVALFMCKYALILWWNTFVMNKQAKIVPGNCVFLATIDLQVNQSIPVLVRTILVTVCHQPRSLDCLL